MSCSLKSRVWIAIFFVWCFIQTQVRHGGWEEAESSCFSTAFNFSTDRITTLSMYAYQTVNSIQFKFNPISNRSYNSVHPSMRTKRAGA